MSFANMPPQLKPSWPNSKLEQDIEMAKWEIHKRAGNLYDVAWWRWMPGETITVKWPVPWEVVSYLPDGSKVTTLTADPNDLYRPWLEKNVGKQRWDWNWALRTVDNRLTIKVRKKHAKCATYMGLIWS